MLTGLIMFGLVLVMIFIFFNDYQYATKIINLIINFLFFLIIYVVGFVINNTINNTYNLKTSIHYDNEYFVNSGFARIAFNDYVKKNEIKVGFCIIFDIINLDSITLNEGKHATDYVEKMFIKYIYQNLGLEYFYFKTKQNKYAVFIGINDFEININESLKNNKKLIRSYNDILKKYEILLDNFPKNIDFNERIYDIQLVGFCSIYGIQTNNFSDLIKLNMQSKITWTFYKNINSIKLYNHKEKITDKDDNLLLQKLKEIYDLKNISFSLTNTILNDIKSSKKEKCYALEIFWIDQLIFSTKMLEEIFSEKNKKHYEILMRYLAYQSLILFNNISHQNNFKKHKLCISLPASYLKDKSFNLILLLLKLNKFNIDVKDIIINIISISKNDFTNKLLKNLEELKEKNILLACSSKSIKQLKCKKYFSYLID